VLPAGVSVKCSSPHGEHERLSNPTLAVSDGEITIKFHPYTLRQIILRQIVDSEHGR
ncbi:VOC family protein, partial [Yersinia pestis]